MSDDERSYEFVIRFGVECHPSEWRALHDRICAVALRAIEKEIGHLEFIKDCETGKFRSMKSLSQNGGR